jgi:cytochrome c peroxidase
LKLWTDAAWAAPLAALLALGCSSARTGGYSDPMPETASAVSSFSDLELASLRDDFGNLPALAPDDVSNAFAGNAAAAKLGQQLFFDTRFSANGQVSCATCHIPEAGFQDNRANTSQGIAFTGRHAPTLLNAAYGYGDDQHPIWQFWDGRKDSLWSQALGPSEAAIEMGSTRSHVALLIYDKYRATYASVFGDTAPLPELRDSSGQPVVDENAGPNADAAGQQAWQALGRDAPDLQRSITRVFVNFGKAIAAYESLLVSRNSRFDQFREALVEGFTDSGHLTESELQGLKLFVSKAACASCHRGPNLTDGKFHNIGVPQTGSHIAEQDAGRADGMTRVKSDEFNCQSAWSDAPDPSACAVAALELGEQQEQAALGAFKTPGLRSVADTAPYFHTGGAATLLDVIEHYAKGGAESGYVGKLDDNVTALELSDQEQQQLVDFLGALQGEPLPGDLMRAPALPE